MKTTDRDWAAAYALQALSDLKAREALIAAGVDRCHNLHFLQMATEKVCKAHLCEVNGESTVRKIHGYVQSVLPLLARQFGGLTVTGGLKAWQLSAIKTIGREIELLAPACDDMDTRRDNTEYPWLGADSEIYVPCRFEFPGIDEGDRVIVTVFALLRAAALSYVEPERAAE